jgi:hypothetical protein
VKDSKFNSYIFCVGLCLFVFSHRVTTAQTPPTPAPTPSLQENLSSIEEADKKFRADIADLTPIEKKDIFLLIHKTIKMEFNNQIEEAISRELKDIPK